MVRTSVKLDALYRTLRVFISTDGNLSMRSRQSHRLQALPMCSFS